MFIDINLTAFCGHRASAQHLTRSECVKSTKPVRSVRDLHVLVGRAGRWGGLGTVFCPRRSPFLKVFLLEALRVYGVTNQALIAF